MDIRIVDGRLTKDAEVKTTSNGRNYLSFNLANNSFANNERTAIYFNVASYNKHDIDNFQKFIKGAYVVVSGKPSESMTIKSDKTYLNRNIIAHHIDGGVRPASTQDSIYQSVAPTPVSVPTPTVQTPVVNTIPQQPVTPVVNTIPQQPVTPIPTRNVAPQQSIDIDDDLPF
jgi:single-stranded DNA-binding protein